MRLKIGVARPCARGSEALRRRPLVDQGPLHVERVHVDALAVLGVGDRRAAASSARSCAPRFGVNSRMPSAASTDLPRMRSTTRRAFCAVRRDEPAAWPALPSRLPSSGRLGAGLRRRRRRRRALDLALAVARVAVERARRRELAELVADRVLGDEHRDELPPVVHGEREADHVGRDRRAARPGLHDPLLADSIIACTFFTRCRSTKGPFLTERATRLRPVLRFAPLHDEACRCACCAASCSPWSACPTASAGGCPSSAPRRRRADGRPGSSRCRGRAAGGRASARARPCRSEMFSCSRLPTCPIGGAAGDAHAPELARGQLQERVVALLRHQLDRRAGAAPELRRRARRAARRCGPSCRAGCWRAAGCCRA